MGEIVHRQPFDARVRRNRSEGVAAGAAAADGDRARALRPVTERADLGHALGFRGIRLRLTPYFFFRAFAFFAADFRAAAFRGAGGFGMSWYKAWTVPPGSWKIANQPMFGISDFGTRPKPPWCWTRPRCAFISFDH